MHLIISKDREEIKRVLHSLLQECPHPITQFYPESFDPNLLLQEIETPPFLSSGKGIVVHELDPTHGALKKLLIRYIERPNPWISLYLTALELSPQHELAQAIQKKGKIFRSTEEKPWEKEKKLVAWLIKEAKIEGYSLSTEAALALVRGIDSSSLRQELAKLICYAGANQHIDIEDIKTISTPVHHGTLWQLGEAMFKHETNTSLKTAHSLLESGMSAILILAHLRSQFFTAIDILAAAEAGEVGVRFPYLKGQLLQKKLQLLKKEGIYNLKKGILLIFEFELKAKNSSTDPSTLLEILIIKYDTLSTAQSIRAS